MSDNLSLAQRFAYSLAATLMVRITIFRSETGLYCVCPSSEFDGDPDSIVSELDPFPA